MKSKRGDKSIGFIAPSAGPRTLSLELSVLPNSGGHLLCQSHNGAEGNRTPDLCSAIAALYQLSYSPDSVSAPTFVSFGASHSLFKLPTQAHPVNHRPSWEGNSGCVQNICTPDVPDVPSVTNKRTACQNILSTPRSFATSSPCDRFR